MYLQQKLTILTATSFILLLQQTVDSSMQTGDNDDYNMVFQDLRESEEVPNAIPSPEDQYGVQSDYNTLSVVDSKLMARSKKAASEVGEKCNPETCAVEGYCMSYTYCKRIESDDLGPADDVGVLVNDTCGKDRRGIYMYFNKDKNVGHGVEGIGACDYWKHLDAATQKQYKNDPDCIPPKCKYTADSPCSSGYSFFPGGKGNHSYPLSCSVPLIFDEPRKTCGDACYVQYKMENGTMGDCRTLLKIEDCDKPISPWGKP